MGRPPRIAKTRPTLKKSFHERFTAVVKKLEPYLKVVGAITTIAGIIGFVCVLFGFDPRYDATQVFDSDIKSHVTPMIAYGASLVESAEASSNTSSPKAYGDYVRAKISADGKGQEVVQAAEVLNALVECRNNRFFCHLSNYNRRRQDVQNFWYTFRPYLVVRRNTSELKNFAVDLENEAKVILDDYIKEGLIPKPAKK